MGDTSKKIRTHIIAGCIGGLVFFILIIAILMIFGLYDYTLIKVLNPSCFNATLDSCKIEAIRELSEKGILLTPAEYTSHIVSYYNSIIMLLVGLFAIFSFIGYFSLRSKLREQIQESLIEMLRDSKEFDKTITENIMGRVTTGFVPNDTFEETSADVAILKEKLLQFEESPANKKIKVTKR